MNLLGPPPLILPPSPDGRPQGPPPLTALLLLGLAGAVLGSFASNMETRLTTFAIADLRGGFGYGVDESSWIAAAHAVGGVAIVPATPFLGAVLSPRRMVALAAALLAIAGALVPLAPNYPTLILLRLLQGAAGGALIPLQFSAILAFTPLHQRPYGFAFYAIVTTATPLVAEYVAGALTDAVDWRAIYYSALVICPVAIFCALAGLPRQPIDWSRFRGADYPGMFLLAASAGILTLGLSEGQRLDWFDSTLIDAFFAAAALLLAAFVARELTAAAPLVDLSLLRRRNLAGGLLMIFVFSFASLGTSLITPQFGQEVAGFRETQVGDILLWTALAQLGVVCLGPFLLRHLEARLVMALGLLVSILGARLAATITDVWRLSDLLPALLLQAAGQPLIMMALLLVATATLQPKEAIAGGTIFNVLRTLAGTLGSAVITGVLTVRERVHSAIIVSGLTDGAPRTVASPVPGGLAAAAHVQATVMGVADAFGWLGVVLLCGLAIPLLLHETRLARPPSRPPRAAALAGLALLLLCLRPAEAAAPADAPFRAALAQAYSTNPELQAERRRLRQTDETVPRALSGWRPRVLLDGAAGVSAVWDNLDPRHSPERRVPQQADLALTQPLYTSGRVAAELGQANAEVAAGRAALADTEARVLLAAASAWCDVARDQRIVELNRHQTEVLRRTLRATRAEQAAGAVTEADVAQAEARFDDQLAASAQAEAALAASRAAFERTIGTPPAGVADLPDGLATPPTLALALARVPTGNFAVARARAEDAAARRQIDIARAALGPQVSVELRGTRVKETDVQQPHQRDDVAEATLQLTLPLYQGGRQAAEIRAAKEAAARASLLVEDAIRQGRQQVETAWQALAAARTRVAAYRRSLAANGVAARGIARQQSVGARTTIEVLNAEQERLAAEVNLLAARRDAIVSSLDLLEATGQLSATLLGLDVPIYDPSRHYEATRDRWYGTTPAP